MKFRPLQITDAGFLNRIRNLYASDYLHDSRTFTLPETEDWLIKTQPDFWIIEISSDSIGYFRLSEHSLVNKNIMIGADIAPEWCGKGYGELAYRSFIPKLFVDYDLNKISLEVLSTNIPAQNLYKKLGFVVEGTKRQEILKGNTFVDSIIMSILKEEYNG